jgi:REP-associated tyrosine transposase
MGRPRRVHYEGAFYHAIIRGNNRRPIFERSQDLTRFEDLVADGVARFGHRIHAYCWMNNHAHLAVEVVQVPLSKIVHNLTSRYSSWFNHRYSRSGHLFERRYRAGLIESEASLCRLVRYIHLNPVRAGLTEKPQQYRWSSYLAYLNPKAARPWLDTDRVLALFSGSQARARARLAGFVKEGLIDEHKAGSVFTLDELFVDNSQVGEDEEEAAQPDPNGSREENSGDRPVRLGDLFQIVVELTGVTADDLRGRSQDKPVTCARALLAVLVQEDQWATMSELARELARHSSTLGRAASGLFESIPRNDRVRFLLLLARERYRKLLEERQVTPDGS